MANTWLDKLGPLVALGGTVLTQQSETLNFDADSFDVSFNSATGQTDVVATGGGGGSGDATSLQGEPIAATTPTTNQFLRYSGSTWAPVSLTSLTLTSLTCPVYDGGAGDTVTIGASAALGVEISRTTKPTTVKGTLIVNEAATLTGFVSAPAGIYAGGASGSAMPTQGSLRLPSDGTIWGRFNNTTDYPMLAIDAGASVFLGISTNYASYCSLLYMGAAGRIDFLISAATTAQIGGDYLKAYPNATFYFQQRLANPFIFQVNSVTIATVNTASFDLAKPLVFETALATPSISQTVAVSGAGATFSLRAQTGGASANGGDLQIGGGAGGAGGGTAGFIQLMGQGRGTSGASIGGGILLTGVTANTIPMKDSGGNTIYVLCLA